MEQERHGSDGGPEDRVEVRLPAAGVRRAEVEGGADRHRYHLQMVASPTIKVEFDRELLERLRQRHPKRSDRELLESMARMTLGRESLRRIQERSTLSEEEAIALGVKAVDEARRKRRAAA